MPQRMTFGRRKSMNSSKNLNKMIKISLLAAIAVVLMYFDFPIIPAFPWLKIDLSEVPALMGGFAYGPVAGGIIVILKVFLRFLIKGTETGFVGALAQTSYVVFDKTGTMTQGVFEVSGVHHNEISDEKLLEYAALAECSSSHPISKSLQKAYGKPIDRNRVTDIEEISGNGVTAKVDGISVAAGKDRKSVV